MRKLLVAIVLILGSEISIRMINHSMTVEPASLPARPLSDISESLGGWSSEQIELDPRIFASSGAADSVKRMYRNADGGQISFFAGTWLDYPPSIPHSPEICYPGNGWDIVAREPIQITPTQDPGFVARLMTCKKQNQSVSILYWIDIGGNRTYDDESIRQALQHSRQEGKPRPPLIKIMLQCSAADPVMAKRNLINLAEAVAPQFSAFEK